jgi:CHAT domain-containing protein
VDSSEQALLRELASLRVGSARFSRAPAAHVDQARYREALAEAQLAVLSMPDSQRKQRLQSFIDVADGKLREAANTLHKLSEANPRDAELLNDLGVIYIGLGEESAVNYIRALDLFERAQHLSPRASAPRFNAVLAYRKAGIKEKAASLLTEYRRREINSFWREELSVQPQSETELFAALRKVLSQNDTGKAEALIHSAPDIYRSMAMVYALAPPIDEPFDETFLFILQTLKNSNQDRTLDGILQPLHSEHHEKILRARVLVRDGIKAYLLSEFNDSLRYYALADEAIRGVGSLFDELWIELNRANSQVRDGTDIKTTRVHVEHVIAESRRANLLWLLGEALTAKASNVQLSENYEESLELARQAITIFSSLGTLQDSARPLYYLASVHGLAGDFETSLQYTTQALRLARQDDHVRLTLLYQMASMQLYRMGFERYAAELGQLALVEARSTGNPHIISSLAPYLATVYASRDDYASARQILMEADALLERMKPSPGKALIELQKNLACARANLATNELDAAGECANRNVDILNRMPVKIPLFSAETLFQLSQIYNLQGNVELARRRLHEAIALVEEDDVYLAGDSLRIAFENERRNLYDAAIALEYDQQAHGAAWSYLQQYRSKMFLEFLKNTIPAVTALQSQAIHRDKVQQLIPQDVQVVEYLMLNDRLLIWIVTNNTLSSVSVPISRAELEKRVSDFVDLIQQKADLRQQAEKLHSLLIGPIEDQLDPRRALAIIPDQALHRLNFSALLSESNGRYLIETYTLMESPNLTALLAGSTDTPRRTEAVAFGAQTDDTNATRELRGLQQVYSDMQIYNGATALKPAFLSSLVNAGVFHYAGHSQDASDPFRSAILLDGNKEGPNSVSAVDIAARHMPANSVVVLASCDSSVGNSRDGLGVRGLTSAFLISGAGSVVGSLWLVEAESTSRLVLSFHKAFAQERLPVAEALRKAQLDFIGRGVHPYYWSGFVVTGNLSALR